MTIQDIKSLRLAVLNVLRTVGNRTKQLTPKLFCIVVISSLLSSAMAMPASDIPFRGISERTAAYGSSVGMLFGPVIDFLSGILSSTPSIVATQETQEFRDSEVVRIDANFPESIGVGSLIQLEAVPYDSEDRPVSGVRLEWSIDTPIGEHLDNIEGHFVLQHLGQYEITVSGAGKSGAFSITTEELSLTSGLSDQPNKLEGDQNQNNLLPFREWDPTNIEYARAPINLRGATPGIPKRNSNFNIEAPILNIAGRAGLDTNLGLTYNSRVWTKMGQEISYDMDKDVPAPGWSIGFGKIINFLTDANPANRSIIQIDGSGSRRFFSGRVKNEASRRVFEGQSTDGSFVKARTVSHGSIVSGQECFNSNTFTNLKYPDGTTVLYGASDASGCVGTGTPITMYPTQITDKHGNYISIVYYSPNAQGSRLIDYVKDTLGRVYRFNYIQIDSKNYLSSITGPGLRDSNGVLTERTFVRLNYKNHTLAYNFSSLTPQVRDNNNNIKVLASIYYPSTNTGFWFGEADSYSPYGMIRKVEEHTGMSFDPVSGEINAGQVSRRRIYAYPDNTTTPIGDVPEYPTVTETWDGMPDPNNPPTTQYLIDWTSPTRTTTVISPGQQGKTVEYSNNSPGTPLDGVVFKTEYFDGNNILLSRDSVEWATANLTFPAHGNTETYNLSVLRPTTISHTEFSSGIGLTKQTINDTFGPYNRVLQMREKGYSGEVLRRTNTTYQDINDSLATEADWGGSYQVNSAGVARIVNLPTQIEIFDANDNRIDHTAYRYDIALVSRIIQPPPPNFAGNACPPQGLCNGAIQILRGNLSNIIKYSIVTNSSLGGQVIDGRTYDTAGNVIWYNPSAAAVNMSFFNYTSSTAYAYPEAVTQGAIYQNAFVQSTATYDINTGVPLTFTDTNQRSSSMEYDLNNWRLKRTTAPTGAYSLQDYNDLTRTYTNSVFESSGVPAGKSVTRTNGLGLEIRSESLTAGADIWDVVETDYDNLGRTKRSSNPFRSNESASGLYWSEVFYDSAGRVEKTVSPDGSQKFNYFDELLRPQGASNELGHTFRVKDPIGREKWHRTDADGNVAEVIEPDPSGNGSVNNSGLLTKYHYDQLGRLVKTEQGSQERKFKYDSLGRITHQKMAETKATLNDAGVFVGEGTGIWSDFVTYHQMSKISTVTDARGVITTFTYSNPSFPQLSMDPLGRLMSVSYNTNGAADVLPAPTVKYAYQATGDISRLISTYTEKIVGGIPERIVTYDFGHDLEGRVTQKTTTLASRDDYPMIVNKTYDALNRLTDTSYPSQYGIAGSPRKAIHNEIDSVGRISNLEVDGAKYASNFAFNSFDQLTSVKIGPAGTNQITQDYEYDPQSGLLENQKVRKGSSTLLDLSYEYQQCSCSTGGSGQITKIINNLDRNKDKAYQYDALARLQKVTGGVNQGWSQTYGYDRFGNRQSVTSLGFESLVQPSQNIGKNTDGKDLPQKNEPLKQSRNSNEIQPLNPVPSAKYPGEIPTPKIVSSGKLEGSWREAVQAEAGPVVRDDKNKSDDGDHAESGSSPETGSSLMTSGTPFDFDGDGKADFGTWRRTTGTLSAGTWAINNSQSGQLSTTQLGAAGDLIAPGDYDGDGKYDRATWKPKTGDWTIVLSSTGSTVTQNWGEKGDAIMPADYDGDGKTDIAVWKPKTGDWWIIKSSDSSYYALNFGGQQYGDIPAVGDYDGDGRADVTVWRPLNGDWYALILQSSSGYVLQTHFGMAGDVPVPADYDGDEKTDMAVWRPSTGVWYILQSSNSQPAFFAFGSESSRDVLVPADYDGDGKADAAVWNPSTGVWTVKQSSTGTNVTHTLGMKDDVAVPSAYIRRSSAPRGQSVEIPRDGHETLTFDSVSNRITTPGFEYDHAGNQTRIVKPDGTAQRFQYDATGRLIKVKNDSQQTIVTYTYGIGRERLVTQDGDESSTNLTYYAWEGGAVISEFVEGANASLVWTKNYIHLGGSLLATQENTYPGEKLQFHHPDQLGTRLVTDPDSGSHFEQNTMPFGTALESESNGSTNQRFTSYDRSASTGLDYANNRFYDSSQGRFTTVDPIKMSAASLMNPQTLNLYSYTANDPINRTDPSGLDWGFPHIGGGGTSTTFPGNGGFPGQTGSSIPGWLSTFLTGVLGNVFNGGTSYAGSFGVPTYFWQLNTATFTASAPPPPPPLSGAGTSNIVNSGGSGGGASGGGGNPGNASLIDPCAGKKGDLDFSDPYGKNWGMEKHILPRHIEQTNKWKKQNKSRYIFAALPHLLQAFGFPAKQAWVAQANQWTFEHGSATPHYQSGKLVSISYSISWPSISTPEGPFFMAFGEDNTGKFAPKGSKTNTNTVWVDKDCQTVITSHPGIPRGGTPGPLMVWDSDPTRVWSAW